MKRILIIGGMGPQASILLHRRIIDEAVAKGAKNNEDFPMIAHLSIPVTDFISKPAGKYRAMQMIGSYMDCLWQS